LGLCVGLQLFARKSEEGVLPGLGWLEADTVRFQFGANPDGLKIPHMGWNYIRQQQTSPLLADLPDEPRFYFVHSYHLICTDASNVVALTAYGYDFPSIVQKGNVYGAQFHPEKSHKFGMALLKNFAERVPC
jgi:imidazole glycerol-phosphate synthase subunit HisH